MLDEKGTVRTHWRPLIDRVAAGDGTGAGRRGLELTRRLIIENGVTYNVYADPQGADRPWGLDPLPLVLTASEWSEIETGVSQRAQMMDALLADLYGPQRLLAEGVVPPELPFGHPNFLWPCHGVVPKGGSWLHIYAADLARAPDGHWWVLSDRTQAPSGAGYALENREIVEQVLPDSIRDLDVRRVRGFFGEMRERMLAAVDTGEKPLAVILTPGPFNETYFEHAYLAGQLGLPLAEGTDLTVRGDTVYLKTLAGLRRVHSIFRRLDDDFCDPVELRSDSALGVPGLLGAVRAGRVVMANALGTGVLESAAWLGFLPGVCERLLGEKLKLPAVATWWCGEQPALDYVLSHLDQLVIKPAYPNQNFEPVFGRALAPDVRASLVARLRARPYAYVAQEHVALSQAPVWRQNGALGLSAKSLSIRVYAIGTAKGFRVMPGGLARVATDAAEDVVSTQRGGGSKDIWVLAERDANAPAVPAASAAPALVRQDDIPSRVVENLYWLGRYAVRCEDKARLIRSTLASRVDAGAWRTA
ncbi:MAG: circularly permuted type 2 ATP-grasp protein, partial [Gammaproteobacteria bacterium]